MPRQSVQGYLFSMHAPNTADNVIITNSTSFDPSASDWTFATWAKFDSVSTNQALLAIQDGGGTGRTLFYLPSTNNQWGTFASGSVQTFGEVPETDKWYRMFLQHDNSANTLTLYKATLAGGVEQVGQLTSFSPNSSDGDFVLFNTKTGSGQPMLGKQARPYFYAGTMSTAQMKADFYDGVPPVAVDDASMLFHLPFNDGTSTPAGAASTTADWSTDTPPNTFRKAIESQRFCFYNASTGTKSYVPYTDTNDLSAANWHVTFDCIFDNDISTANWMLGKGGTNGSRVMSLQAGGTTFRTVIDTAGSSDITIDQIVPNKKYTFQVLADVDNDQFHLVINGKVYDAVSVTAFNEMDGNWFLGGDDGAFFSMAGWIGNFKFAYNQLITPEQAARYYHERTLPAGRSWTLDPTFGEGTGAPAEGGTIVGNFDWNEYPLVGSPRLSITDDAYSILIDVNDERFTSDNVLDPNGQAFTVNVPLIVTEDYSSGGAHTIVSQSDGSGTGRSWIQIPSTDDKITTFLGGSELDLTTWIPKAGDQGTLTLTYDGSSALNLYWNGKLKGGVTGVTAESATGSHNFANHKSSDIAFAGLYMKPTLYSQEFSADEVEAYHVSRAVPAGATEVLQFTYTGSGSTLTNGTMIDCTYSTRVLSRAGGRTAISTARTAIT